MESRKILIILRVQIYQMDTLRSLIQSLNKEELRFFKIYSQRYSTGVDALGSRLLDLLRKNTDANSEDEIFHKLYGNTGSKNTYYRLKNRLQDDVCNALVMVHFNKSDRNHLHFTLSLTHILVEKGKHELAWYFLKRAEKNALETENFEILDLIYSSIVRISNEVLTINPEEYIRKQSENAQLLNRLRQMDQVLAALNYRIKLAQNFQRGNENLLKLAEKTVREFAKDKSVKPSRTLQTKIYRAISQAMIQGRNFKALEPFLLKTYNSFAKNRWFDKSSHDVKLQMLVYIVNSLFMNRKFEESLEYARLLGRELDTFDGLLKEKYLFFYYNSLVINYAQTNIGKALGALDEFEHINHKNRNSYYEQFIHLNRATLYFDTTKYPEAIRSLTKLYLNDNYKQADQSFKLQIEMAEVIMQFESKDTETASRRARQISRSYKELLASEQFSTEKRVIEILEALVRQGRKKIEGPLYKEMLKVIDSVSGERDSTMHVLNYASWLAPKIGIDLNKYMADRRNH